MGVWNTFRRFAERRGDTPRRAARAKRRRAAVLSRPRELRVEQFEDRVLLSIGPPTPQEDPLWSYTLQQAIARAADLTQYQPDALAATHEWVVGIADGASAAQLANSIGADSVQTVPVLGNAYVWQFPPNVSPQQAASRLGATPGVSYSYPLVETPRVAKAYAPNDPDFPLQWNLRNTGQGGGLPGADIDVFPAWQTVLGQGVVIGIVDDGLEWTHPDLVSNYVAADSYDFANNDPDPMPVLATDNHGTAVAGMAAARGNNGIGVTGVAPNASLAGLRQSLMGNDAEEAAALSYKPQDIAIYNNSWGPADAVDWLRAPGPAARQAIFRGVQFGRSGLGNVYVWAGGNGRIGQDNVNYDGYANSRYVIAVASLDRQGRYAAYSEPGACLLVSAYADGVWTTDRVGAAGYDPSDYFNAFGGTSAAAPEVAGVVALMLEARPDLSWRDVQFILAATAKRNDPTDPDWVQNRAGYWVNHNYGFGAVDAAAAVARARTWRTLDPEISLRNSESNLALTIPGNSNPNGISRTLTLGNQIGSIERVEVTLNVNHAQVGNLEVFLQSPPDSLGNRTISRLAEIHSDPINSGYNNWTFTTTRDLGESSGGDWTLIIRNRVSTVTGTLNSWSVTAYGTAGQALGPELIAVIPNVGERIQDGDLLTVAPRELTLRFSEGQRIDPTTLDAIQLVRAGGDGQFGPGGTSPDMVVLAGAVAANDWQQQGWRGIGDKPNEVILRFAEALPDDLYQLQIVGSGLTPLKNFAGKAFHDGQDLTLGFEIDLAPQIVAVVPQPVTRDPGTGQLQQSRNTIEVYFNNDDLSTAGPTSVYNTSFYSLIAVNNPGDPLDDTVVHPTGITYDAASDKAVLTFSDAIENLGSPSYLGVRTFRLRIGNEYRVITTTETAAATDPGSSFLSAYDLPQQVGNAFTGADPQALVVSAAIEPQAFYMEWPGAIDEPGHRDLPDHMAGGLTIEDHYGRGPDGAGGVPTYYYNFKPIYAGSGPTAVYNMITEAQKQRAREIFELYSHYLGVQFIETADQGLTIVTGDPRVLMPTVPAGPGGVGGIAGGGMAIMNNAIDWGTSPFGGGWFTTAMHEIGHLLGYGHCYDAPPGTIMGASEDPNFVAGGAEPVFPGDWDIVHGQYMYRPDSNDIDLYKFNLTVPGTLSVETIAERFQSSSSLNTLLTLYNASHEVVARNDDYFSNDSYIELHLAPGTYYVAVTASGNADFNPEVDNSGLGGTTQGPYDLRLNFEPDPTASLSDADHQPTALDGDGDGAPGGVYNFWFNAQTPSRTLFVDKLGPASGNDGSLAKPYRLISSALARAAADSQAGLGDIVRIVGNNFANDNGGRTVVAAAGSQIVDGRTFTVSDGKQTVVFEFDKDVPPATAPGNVPVPYTLADTADLVAGAVAGAINAARASRGLMVSAVVNGSTVALSGQTVVFDRQAGPLKTTLEDNIAYEIGRSQSNRILADGEKMELPRGVTVMIDAGAVFKLRGANIDVGSSAQQIDRSHGALQVLGTPEQSVYFTSYQDQLVGNDTEPLNTTGAKGDWGGLVFRNNLDYDEMAHDPNRRVLETAGIFLDYVNHADLRYGGGRVTVNGVSSVYTPIHLAEARATVSFNTISHSADAAISADPNSFLESKFEAASDTASAGKLFTADYDRVGPDVHGNHLADNSVNGMFVRIRTDAGVPLDKLEVPGRFDDLDIVHVIAENLVITGTPGGPIVQAGTCVLTATDTSIQSYAARDPGTGQQAINDGHYFSINDGFTTVVFEFDNNGLVTPNRVAVPFQVLDSAQTIANSLAGAINGAAASKGLKVSAAVRGVGSPPTEWYVDVAGSVVLFQGFTNTKARTDARLAIDPGVITKLKGSRIETEMSGQFVAEGTKSYPVIFSSIQDDRYGAGGTFDTSNDKDRTPAVPGDWASLNFGPVSEASIDWARVYYAGGNAPIEGGFAGFDPIEVRQAIARVTNTLFENNGANWAGDRNGRGFIGPATIYVRGAQPILVANTFRNNQGAVASIDVNALKSTVVRDWGRSTGPVAAFSQYDDNYGPMVRDNRFAGNGANGMVVRGGTLTTQVVWDDTDIAHIVYDEITVPNFHTFGGLRLQSSADESLVVKLRGATAGLTAAGRPLEIDDRIGGAVQVVGTAAHPVILTSLSDDTVAAGFDPQDQPQFDTNNDGPSQGAPGDWRSVKIDRYSNDRNVAVVNELEPGSGLTDDANAIPAQAQWIGNLATTLQGGDDVLRLGFEVHGFIRSDAPADQDVYSFNAAAGQEVWIDIDRTAFALDTVVDLIDADGNVLAWSDNSLAENAPASTTIDGQGLARPMAKSDWTVKDYYSQNPLDAGMRVVLPGPAGEVRTYYVRVRAAVRSLRALPGSAIQDGQTFSLSDGVTSLSQSTVYHSVTFEFDSGGGVSSGNIAVPFTSGSTTAQVAQAVRNAINLARSTRGLRLAATAVDGTVVVREQPAVNGGLIGFDPGSSGLSQLNPTGEYQLQVRLQELQEIPGSIVSHAWISYATNGIEVYGQPGHSPLLGETAESSAANNTLGSAQPIGNLLASDRETLALGGTFTGYTDVDFYRLALDMQAIQSVATVNDSGSRWPLEFDLDYADGMGRPNTNMWVYDSSGKLLYIGLNANVADDLPAPNTGAGTADLSRGSFGTGDPSIGPVYLAEGNGVTYDVAVTTLGPVPNPLQPTLADGSPNPLYQPLLRLEPVDSIQRITEDHIGSQNGSRIAQNAQYEMFSGTLPIQLNSYADDFHLGDVTLYVNSASDLYTVDPFTGQRETDVTGAGAILPGAAAGRTYQDLAMSNDGRLNSISWVNNTLQEAQMVWHDTGNATTLYNPQTGAQIAVGGNPDGINCGEVDRNSQAPGTACNLGVPPGEVPGGLQFKAIAFDPYTDTSSRYTVAIGDIQYRGYGVQYWQNLVYVLDSSGRAVQRPDTTAGPRVTSDIIPLGQLEPPNAADVDSAFVPTLSDDVDPVYVPLGLNDNFDPAYVPAGTYANSIVFASNYTYPGFGANPEGDYELYVMNQSGTVTARLTNNAFSERSPSVSGDGSKVVFTSDRTGNSEVYFMNLAPEGPGNLPVNLTNDPANSPASDFSPKFKMQPSGAGYSIVWSSNRVVAANPEGDFEVFVMDIDAAGTVVATTQVTQNTANDVTPAFSYDGTSIIYATNQTWGSNPANNPQGDYEIVQILAATALPAPNPDVLLTNNAVDDYAPVWARNSTDSSEYVAYQKNAAPAVGWDLWRLDPLAPNPRATEIEFVSGFGDELTPTVRADGASIAFATDRDGHFEIYATDLTGSTQTRITRTDFSGPQRVVFASQVNNPALGYNNPEGDYELYMADVSPSGSLANLVQLTNNAFDDRTPDVSPDGLKLVFASSRDWSDGNPNDGKSELYMMDLAAESPTNLAKRLTVDAPNNPANDQNPKFSQELYLPGATTVPGAKYSIVWSSNRFNVATNPTRDFEIFRMDVNASGSVLQTTQVTQNTVSDVTPSFSPDRSPLRNLTDVRIAFATNLVVANINPQGDYEIVWLPANGRLVAAVPNANFLTQNNAIQDIAPVWARNVDPTSTVREWIAYQKFTGRPNGWDLYKLNPTDAAPQNTETAVGSINTQADDQTPNFGPDGSVLVFASNRDGQFELYRTDVNGPTPRRLTNNGVSNPRIVFSSDRDGDYELYVMNFDGSNQIKLTDNNSNERSPHVSPDGKKLIFTSDRTGESKVYVIAFDALNPIPEGPGNPATRLTAELGEEQTPQFSGDIDADPALTTYRIAFSSNRPDFLDNPEGDSEIFAVDDVPMPLLPVTVASGDLVQVTRNTDDDVTPSFSPDQNPDPLVHDIRYVYATNQRETNANPEGDFEIVYLPVYTAQGTYASLSPGPVAAQYLTRNVGVDDRAPVWSLNTMTGRERVFYQKFRVIDWDVYNLDPTVAQPQNTEAPVIMNFGAEDVTPAVSQDGIWVTWATNGDGQYEIYRARYDGLNQTRLTDDSGKLAKISGLAYVGGILYAVAENGYLYWISDSSGNPLNLSGGPTAWDWGFKGVDPPSPPGGPKYIKRIPRGGPGQWAGPKLNYITTVTDASGQPIRFSGLSAGPQNVEPDARGVGKFSQMLFATDSTGYLYAMDVLGNLQPIFLDAQTQVDTGVANAAGLAFSPIDYNLWHVTNKRGSDWARGGDPLDRGHGIEDTESFETSRPHDAPYPVSGGWSFYFGLEDPRATTTTISQQPGAGNFIDRSSAVFQTYDVPGGAYGSLTTNTFSLKGYDPNDLPTLYFTYFADTAAGPWDQLRVFISTGSNGGDEWQKLAAINGAAADGWRQARISLADYAGYSNLRLRFDFSTAGDMQVGTQSFGGTLGSNLWTGTILHAVPGNQLVDGNYFDVNNPTWTGHPGGADVRFEFDMGYALVMPNVAGITIPGGPAGEWIRITDNNNVTHTFQFNGAAPNVAVSITAADSAAAVAQKLANAINTAFGAPPTAPFAVIDSAHPERVFLKSAAEWATSVTQSAGPTVVLEGDAPGTVTTGAQPIPVRGDMTATEIAVAIGEAMDRQFGGWDGTGTAPETAAKVDPQAAVVHLIGHGIATKSLPLPSEGVVPQPGLAPLAYSTTLPGDDNNVSVDRFRDYGRGQDNRHEGVYIDDIIIGFAEHGEMVTAANADPTFWFPPEPPTGAIVTGNYQMEIRRGQDYGVWGDGVLGQITPFGILPPLARSFDTNDRFTSAYTLDIPPAAMIPQGASFVIGDGINKQTFRLIDPTKPLPGQTDGVPIYFSNRLSSAQVSALVVSAINRVTVIDVTASSITAQTLRAGGSSRVELFGAKYLAFDNLWANNVTHAYGYGDTLVARAGITKVPMARGDANRFRDQGQVILEANRITNSSAYGIVVDSVRDQSTPMTGVDWPHPAPVLPLIENNTQRLVPGMTILNNVIAFNRTGGIHFSGDPNAANQPVASVPFGRIVNNTIYGQADPTSPRGVGVLVDQNASPTLLNNIVASLDTGIQVDASSATTVVGTTVYQNNGTNVVGTTLGTFPLTPAMTDPLFVDAAGGNFYPDVRSVAIDSALNSLADRPAMVTVRRPLGIPDSPILAPDRDLYGQLRIDDPNVSPPSGMGGNIFKDRGAIDRVDNVGPTAALVDPLDNDPANLDRDRNPNDVLLVGALLTEFSIQLSDKDGVGIADNTVTPAAVEILRDGNLLAIDLDYLFSYDPINDVINLYPAAGVWAQSSGYVIELKPAIRDLADNPIQPNRPDGSTKFQVTLSSLDFGDAPDPTFPTLKADDGARHIIFPDTPSGPGFYLGAGVTGEPDANQNALATGDAKDDGVVIGPLLIGTTVPVQITVSGTGAALGKIDAWMDFNGDGDWNDTGEQIFTSQPVNGGVNDLSIVVPDTAKPGYTFARFRLSKDGGLSYTGEAPDGEVEDYRWRLVRYPEDFGDAPEPPYPTLFNDIDPQLGGASHQLDPSKPHLGASVNADADGQPSALADADSYDDGVQFDGTTPLVPGQVSRVMVNASGPGSSLSAWIDFNHQNGWEPGEKLAFYTSYDVATDTLSGPLAGPLAAGTSALYFRVPLAGTLLGYTFSRFRLCSDPAQIGLPTGPATDGEVEDYRVLIIDVPLDYGDAPSPYPTLKSNHGARHRVDFVHYLGATVDYEPDGQPNPTATGDPDDDGVRFVKDPSVPGDIPVENRLVPDHTAEIVVTASAAGVLSAWIDFNADGDWMDMYLGPTGDPAKNQGDHVAFYTDDTLTTTTLTPQLVPGENHLKFYVPKGLTAAQSFARFRFSDQAILSYQGPDTAPYPVGEVEDYQVQIVVGSAKISGYKFNDLNANRQWDRNATSVLPAIQLLPPGQLVGMSFPFIAPDDGSSAALNLGFNFEFYGNTYQQFYINANGTVTFGAPLTPLTPIDYQQNPVPMIAPFWSDVDIQFTGGVHLAYGTSQRGNPFVQVDWVNVGYYNLHFDKTNSFTLYIEDDPGGDMVQFVYNKMEWTTGDRDPGHQTGFLGQGAQIGFDAGPQGSIDLGRPRTQADLASLLATKQYGFRFDPSTGRPSGIEAGVSGVTVYLDLNNNGVWDSGEPSTVTATDDLATPGVDETGYYEFTKLLPGTYVVREVIPDHWSDPLGQDWGQTYPYSGVDSRLAHAGIRAVAGDQLSDGQMFSVSDGTVTLIFEFDNNNAVAAGHKRVEFTAVDPASTVAAAIAAAINAAGPTDGLAVTAAANLDVVSLTGPKVTFHIPAHTLPLVPPPLVHLGEVTLKATDAVTDVNFGNYKVSHVGISDVSVVEGNSGQTQVNVTLHFTESFGAPITFNYATANGTATTADNDYRAAAGVFQLAPQSQPLPRWDLKQVTHDLANDYNYSVWGDKVVYQGNSGVDTEIYLYDDATGVTRQISEGSVANCFATIYGSNVVWAGKANDGDDFEIFHYGIDTGVVTRLTDNTFDDQNPQVSDRFVVWWGASPGGRKSIYAYDLTSGGAAMKISDDSFDNADPQVSGSYVVWSGTPAGVPGATSDVFFWDGTFLPDGSPTPPRRLTNGGQDNVKPRIDGPNVVWQAAGATNHRIMWWDGTYQPGGLPTAPVQISSNLLDNLDPQISGDNVVWQGVGQIAGGGQTSSIQWYDLAAGGPAVDVSGTSLHHEAPKVFGDRIVWSTYDGADWEVSYYEIGKGQMPLNITNNDYFDGGPLVSGSLVIWRSFRSGTSEVVRAIPRTPELTQTITLFVNGDTRLEPDEYFFLDLSSPDLAVLDTSRATITILNDDGTLDYGDAPAPYPTLLAGNGARHSIVAGAYLGSRVDSEANGLPTAQANGDDTNGADDEDGVAFSTPLVTDMPAQITVTASVSGYLDAWIDFNGDGSWDDWLDRWGEAQTDHLFASHPVAAGQNVLGFTVPRDARPGSTYARFRFRTTAAPISYTGTVLGGEVEDYLVQIQSNVVRQGPVVIATGTGGDDIYKFWAGPKYIVSLNGIVTKYNPADVNSFTFDGMGGYDRVYLYGDPRSETAQLNPTAATFGSSLYNVAVSDVDSITASGGGGSDAATFSAGSGTDVFVATPAMASLVGPGVSLRANNFPTVIANGTPGGQDIAYLMDSTAADTLEAYPTYAVLHGTGFSSRANDFAYVTAKATQGGTDVAKLFDSAGDDTFTAYPAYSTMTGRYRPPGAPADRAYYNRAEGFGSYEGTSSAGGADLARLYDSATGDEQFTAGPTQGTLMGAGLLARATGFRYLIAYATGGTDTARLDDSAGTDTFVGTPGYSVLYAPASANNPAYLNRAGGFDAVDAYSTHGGDDIAYLYDSAGDDVLTATPLYAKLQNDPSTNNTSYAVSAHTFRYTHTYANSGGFDKATLTDSSGFDTFEAHPTYSILSNSTSGQAFYNRALYFDQVVAVSSGLGNDTAKLYDSPGNEAFQASPTSATLAGAGFSYQAQGFRYVMAYATTGGDEAFLTDSAGADTFIGSPTSARLTNAAASYYIEARQFAKVTLTSVGGNDTATLSDSAGNDTFWGHLADAVLSDGTLDLTNGDLLAANSYYLRLLGFASSADQVSVSGTAGGTNTRKIVTPVDYALAFTGTWTGDPWP